MSGFNNESVARTARTRHRCTYCAETIEPRESYIHQTGVHDESWYITKMHPECWDDCLIGGMDEYMPYSNPRPDRKEATP